VLVSSSAMARLTGLVSLTAILLKSCTTSKPGAYPPSTSFCTGPHTTNARLGVGVFKKAPRLPPSLLFVSGVHSLKESYA
jgi:hypothetical protein